MESIPSANRTIIKDNCGCYGRVLHSGSSYKHSQASSKGIEFNIRVNTSRSNSSCIYSGRCINSGLLGAYKRVFLRLMGRDQKYRSSNLESHKRGLECRGRVFASNLERCI